ncbi:hypothetical protein DYB37_004970 [Aphanomyces astaci]|uniref:Centrosomal protein of 19 kDa n=1 Tax=Aphanomyces astaci TaxID=112090 RepID=A0A3R6WWN8_APHAT|nr:hypothetical protein DYB35_002757 [Aphanomyces astaci]RHZ05552.1 hypothetical protein DYB37_004970 [Aphanomyces astaci]
MKPSSLLSGVVPKRLGLKYGPVPTLALEYEDISRQLKLAVVELPHLTLHATPSEIAAGIQKEHQLFGPSLVNEDQLVRLMQRLLQSQHERLIKQRDDQGTLRPTGTTLLNSSQRNEEAKNDEKEEGSDKGDNEDDDEGKEGSDDDEYEKVPPNTTSAGTVLKPDDAVAMSPSPVVQQPRAVEELAKDDSEFDESFEEESFVEASADKGSFLTQSPTTKESDDDDEMSEATKGKFGSGIGRAEPVLSQATPSVVTEPELPAKVPNETKQSEKTSIKVDESADDIPSEEELGGDESGDDDGF